MSRATTRHAGSRAYNLARAHGRSPGEIRERAWAALQRAHSAGARAVLRVMLDRAEAES